jgi:hypothetical protein
MALAFPDPFIAARDHHQPRHRREGHCLIHRRPGGLSLVTGHRHALGSPKALLAAGAGFGGQPVYGGDWYAHEDLDRPFP